MKKILGISCYYHDAAAALVVDGNMAAAAEEERFSRKKHDDRFPEQAVRFCLEYAKTSLKDIDLVVFYDKPILKFDRLLETYISYAPLGLSSFLRGIPIWIKDKLWTMDELYNQLEGYEGDIIFPEHHQSHAASAFFPSPFQRAAFLTMDGVGEWTTTSFGKASNNEITLLKEIQFPHSLGLLYSAFTYYTGFKVNSGEYKLMGLAPYGEPKYVQTIYDNLLDVKNDGSFRLNMDYFKYPYGLTMTNKNFEKLFGGKPRKPEDKITQKDMDLARSIQVVTEETVIKIAREVKKITGEHNLVMAGGVALNCVANGQLWKENIFDKIWIQPASGDSGGALGAALFGWHVAMNQPKISLPDHHDHQQGSYLGPEYSNQEIESFLTNKNIKFHSYKNKNLTKKIAELLTQEKVIGLFRGRMEFGPRALGNRSIIGDARSEKMQSVMNLKIKFRESFRPFAPIVKVDKVSEWFEYSGSSPYMLMVANVLEKHRKLPENKGKFGIDLLNEARSTIPAVTHVDYSARLQTVDQSTNPFLYELLDEFENLTQVPILINTSFNVRGEPIVCNPEEALFCFLNTGMDVLVLEDSVLFKEEMEKVSNNENYLKKFELD